MRVWWFDQLLGNADNTTPGPTDYELWACLELSDQDLNLLIDSLDSENNRERLTKPQPWLPEEIKSIGAHYKSLTYDARRLVVPPYTNGSLEHITGTNYIILRFNT